MIGFCSSPAQLTVGTIKSRHIGAAPQLAAMVKVEASDAHSMINMDELLQLSDAEANETASPPAFKLVRAFLREPNLLLAARAFDALRALMPDGTKVIGLAKHLKVGKDELIAALALLDTYGALEIGGDAVRIAPKFFWEKTQ